MNTEKRVNKRYNCEASLICNCFNKEETFNARMLNYSKDGMYFKSNSFFKEGTNIYFKMTNCLFFSSEPEDCEGLRTVSLAEIKWCKEMRNEDASCFGIGVKYY